MTVQDIPDVLAISVECGLCLWSSDAYRAELVRQDSILLKVTGEESNAPIGFAVGRIFDFSTNVFTVELTNIGVRQQYRNQGLGSLLLKHFLNRCQSVGASSVILEVRVSNATAIRFYEKFGFQPAGRRRGFYSLPFEDALTMRLDIAREEPLRIHT